MTENTTTDFKGYVPAECKEGFSLTFKPEYITSKGENHGPVLFIGRASKTKVAFESVSDAIKAAAESGELPKDARVFANKHYVKLDAAVKMDLAAYVFNNRGRQSPWKMSILDKKTMNAENDRYAAGSKPKAKRTAPVQKALF